jgi:hypothetical protein
LVRRNEKDALIKSIEKSKNQFALNLDHCFKKEGNHEIIISPQSFYQPEKY